MREGIDESVGGGITLFVEYNVGSGIKEEEGVKSESAGGIDGAEVYGIFSSGVVGAFGSSEYCGYADGHVSLGITLYDECSMAVAD